MPEDGLIISNGLDANVHRTMEGIGRRVEWCALRPGFDWSTRITGIVNGCHTGEVSYQGRVVASLKLSVPGEHNLINATMAVAACHACGVAPDRAAEAIGRFTGVDRRMMEVGRSRGAIIVDDYGHHPTEIRATLAALREKYQPQRLICVFQPHQHSRTRFLLDEFATAFSAATHTVVPDIYFVRDSEAERQRVSSGDLVDRVRQNGQDAVHIPSFADIVAHLKPMLQPGDVVVTMGAGNVWEIGRDLVES